MRASESVGSSDRKATPVRWDIQGLRAFAVISVVLYHLWPGRLTGGFTGVDIFFVISGYLITAHLVREVRTFGHIDLPAFWSRRAKRLLPSSFITLAVVAVAVFFFVSPSLWTQYARELIASVFYVQNWQLAADSVDYLSSTNAPSPFQHFWSLSVEEQFYILLPLLLIVTIRIRVLPVVTRVRLLLVAVIVLSLGWSIVQTAIAEPVAYFSTATRAWEFALGGLVSTFAFERATTGRLQSAKAILAWGGAAALVCSVVLVEPSMPFPGYIAIVPVVGASLVVAFGAGSTLERVGSVKAVAFVGRISYSLYLWHWPLIVLVPLATGHSLTGQEKIVILVGSVLLAWVTTALVEEPLRFSLVARQLQPRRTALIGGLLTICIALVGVGTLAAAESQRQRSEAFAQSLAQGDLDCFGAAAEVGSSTPCINPQLASIRVPDVASAASDDANRKECWSNTTAEFAHCQLGPTTGYTRSLLAIGDSHNNVLVAAYEAIANRFNWRIDVAGHIGCYWTSARQYAPTQEQEDVCSEWKSNATEYISENPDLSAVIVTNSSSDAPVLPPAGESPDVTTVSGLTTAWATATQLGIPVIAIRDNPRATADTMLCIARMKGVTTAACDLTRDSALGTSDPLRSAVDATPDTGYIDLSEFYCTATSCPVVIGGVVVYRDATHLTATFAKTLVPFLGPALDSELTRLGR